MQIVARGVPRNFLALRMGPYTRKRWIRLVRRERQIEEDNSLVVLTSFTVLNPLTPNNPYSGRTAPLTSKRCILYIYSTNIGSEYFKHGIYSTFFSS